MANKEGRVAVSFITYNKTLLLLTFLLGTFVTMVIIFAALAPGVGKRPEGMIALAIAEVLALAVAIVTWHRLASRLESATLYRCRTCGWHHVLRKFDVWPTNIDFEPPPDHPQQ
jgi:hypothetical protein